MFLNIFSDSPFKNLNALQNLFLSNNEIVTITDEFTNLKNLQVLALDHNKIHKVRHAFRYISKAEFKD